jgi:ribosomal protein L37AE/L43A
MQNRTKPDPSQPWRYVCPECYPGKVKQVHRSRSSKRYHCTECGNTFEKDELFDQQMGEYEGNVTAAD